MNAIATFFSLISIWAVPPITLVITIVLFVLAYRLGQWKAKSAYKLEQWNAKHDELTRSVNNDIKPLIKNMDARLIRVEAVLDVLVNKKDVPIQSKSPLAISEAGYKMIEEISAHAIFARIAKDLDILVDKENLTTAYDVQEACLLIITKNLDSLITADELKRIKDLAYNHSLSMQSIYSMFSLLLRDRTLKRKSIAVPENKQ